MRHNADRILVSHAGNLPRPKEMNALLEAKNIAEYRAQVPSGVGWIVNRQISLGVDIVNDGEYIKAGSYGGYIQERLAGFESRPYDPRYPHQLAGGREIPEFPGTAASGLWYAGSGGPIRPGFVGAGARPATPASVRVATGPVMYTGQAQIQADIASFKAALNGKPVDGFLASLGPLSTSQPRNEHYKTDEAYLLAVAEAVGEEYKAIARAGLILQIDEPVLATAWQRLSEMSVPQYRAWTEQRVEAINHALRGVPEEQVRLHVCWGSGHRPHTQDIELKHVADLWLKARAHAYSIEAANVRHAHEWKVWKDVKVPDGKILMPGVVAHATDLVEHPELIADRLESYASVVGRENVQTGTDCGIGSRVGHEEIVWAKLAAMSEGARIASNRLWKARGGVGG